MKRVSNNLRIRDSDWSANLWARIRAIITDVNAQISDIVVPEATSDLTNDGDGQSPFATEGYVDANGGKIDVIKLNGVAQPIVNKTVDLSVEVDIDAISNSDIDDIVDAPAVGMLSMMRYVSDADGGAITVNESVTIWNNNALAFTATATEVT